MSNEVILKYSEVRSSLKTFDILNCVYGTNPINPMHWIWAAVGHTAMVYRCKETEQIFVYESTQMGRSDGLSGVQLRPMKQWLEDYPGKVYLRHTYIEALFHRISAEIRCAEHIKKYRGTEYPDVKKWKWRWFLANAALDLPFKTKLQNPDIDFVLFCSMLLGHAFRFCSLVHNIINPAEVEPDDLREDSEKFANFLLPGVTLGSETRIEV